MNPRIIYPVPRRQLNLYRIIREICRYAFLVAGIVCALINFLVKGKPWSVIVIWSLISTWRLVFSFRLVEFSIYSHLIRFTFYLSVMLILIDRFLVSGWAETTVPIVMFSYLLIMFIVYYATYSRRSRHLVSIMLLGLLNLILIPYSLHSWPISNWVAFAFQIASLILFIIMIIANWKEVLYEIRARFMTGTK